jgi:hypothetical protein
MTSPNLQFLLHGAPDALFDQIEHDLATLTTAPLDEEELGPAQVVDEFATEFLMDWTAPPPPARRPPEGGNAPQLKYRRPGAGRGPC